MSVNLAANVPAIQDYPLLFLARQIRIPTPPFTGDLALYMNHPDSP